MLFYSSFSPSQQCVGTHIYTRANTFHFIFLYQCINIHLPPPKILFDNQTHNAEMIFFDFPMAFIIEGGVCVHGCLCACDYENCFEDAWVRFVFTLNYLLANGNKKTSSSSQDERFIRCQNLKTEWKMMFANAIYLKNLMENVKMKSLHFSISLSVVGLIYIMVFCSNHKHIGFK